MDGGPGGRQFADAALPSAASTCFALGAATIEQVKHLTAAAAGPLAGLTGLPGLRTLRLRLAGIADATDPLELQAMFAQAMLAADPVTPLRALALIPLGGVADRRGPGEVAGGQLGGLDAGLGGRDTRADGPLPPAAGPSRAGTGVGGPFRTTFLCEFLRMRPCGDEAYSRVIRGGPPAPPWKKSSSASTCHQGKRVRPSGDQAPEDHDRRKLGLRAVAVGTALGWAAPRTDR